MEQVTVTYGEIQQFVAVAKNYLAQKDIRPSHLTQALSKELKMLKSYIDDADDLRAEARIDLAKKDKDGVIEIHDNGMYKMKAEDSKKLQEKIREINDTEVLITPYYAKTVPASLALGYYDFFVPFVIKDYPEPEEE